MRIPVNAISMGDAGGIGPELIVKVLATEDIMNIAAHSSLQTRK